MIEITFNAFSSLQKKLKKENIEFQNATLKIPKGIKIEELIKKFGLSIKEVEVVFINGRVKAFDTIIKDKDRVAFVPQGTPGPYRVLMGFVKLNKVEPKVELQ